MHVPCFFTFKAVCKGAFRRLDCLPIAPTCVSRHVVCSTAGVCSIALCSSLEAGEQHHTSPYQHTTATQRVATDYQQQRRPPPRYRPAGSYRKKLVRYYSWGRRSTVSGFETKQKQQTERELLLQRERWVKSKHMYLIRGSVGAEALFLPIRRRIKKNKEKKST